LFINKKCKIKVHSKSKQCFLLCFMTSNQSNLYGLPTITKLEMYPDRVYYRSCFVCDYVPTYFDVAWVVWSSGIVYACHRGDRATYVSWDRIPPRYVYRGSLKTYLKNSYWLNGSINNWKVQYRIYVPRVGSKSVY
jgi:hypothetical protein